MATQTIKKIYSVLIIVALFTMMVSTFASTIEICVKHCVPNQCIKVFKKATLPLCENACKKLCNQNKFAHVKFYSMPPQDLCEGFFGLLCNN
ncbi:Plant thionin family protein [Arabidopsis thaliana]|uniref:Plant thionin family protein n=1 Tax=Arabidopsis thaliana TaxID=3702 RepID=A8MRM7_ARATH|nr:Plant thionin family protein [Arabidopsis thaliana]AED93911.1 Plant thionin family protein [Arabidopsis thaliana]|eukprot:NP_001078633.1 Plant thionin family protein [Arabidopsis thaliana]